MPNPRPVNHRYPGYRAARPARIEGLEFKFAMSCRIDRVVGGEDRVALRLIGRIEAENLDTLREVLGPKKCRVVIDLGEVVLVDREAMNFLPLAKTTE